MTSPSQITIDSLGDSAAHVLGQGGLLGLVVSPTDLSLVDRALVWEYPPTQRPVWNKTEGMLDAFIRIEDDNSVLAFARKYAPLELCKHGLPMSHRPPPYDGRIAGTREQQRTVRRTHSWCVPSQKEPLIIWKSAAHRARAILDTAALLHADKNPSDELMKKMLLGWRPALNALYLADPFVAGWGERETKELILSIMVNEWLYTGGVRPYLSWGWPGAKHPQISFGYGTYGSLAVQLMLAVSRATNLTQCSGCSFPYIRQGRVPQAGRRNFCPTCHDNGVDVVVRKRAFRERIRQGQGSGQGGSDG